MKITIVTHYSTNDPKFYKDYFWIEILDITGKQIVRYEDDYHDGGLDKIKGFIDGLKWACDEGLHNQSLEIEKKNVADYEY